MNRRLLTPEEIAARLPEVPDWRVEDGQLVCERAFPGYRDGLAFAVAVAELAEERNHHPDILLAWRKVRLSLCTHSAGGLTELDFALAAAVSRLPRGR